MILTLYRWLTDLGEAPIRLLLQQRLKLGKEDPGRVGERTGQAGLPRPSGRLVWLHAASVGEAMSMLPVIDGLLARHDLALLLTTGTVTSAKLMAERLPDRAFHQYVPIDRRAWVRRFLDHWRPDLVLWAESEFWPNLLLGCGQRSITAILLNGRISDRSFARWLRWPQVIRPLLAVFSLCLGQTEQDAGRLRQLGARKSLCLGNLKYAAPKLPADETLLAELRDSIGARPLWLAASTHDGEEALAGRLHRLLCAEFPTLLTIIVPRHPNRGDSVAATLDGQGLQVARRSLGQSITPNCQIYLADSMGELGLFYRLSPLVFVGKSLVGQGGQNPLEPARLGASILFGPNMGNFIDMAERMREAGAATQIGDEEQLLTALRLRLADPERMRREGALALDFSSSEERVLEDVLAAIASHLPSGGADARP